MTRGPYRDDLAGGYVECSECGHPIEDHNREGCDQLGGECTCREPWTAAEIRRVRIREGLPARRRIVGA